MLFLRIILVFSFWASIHNIDAFPKAQVYNPPPHVLQSSFWYMIDVPIAQKKYKAGLPQWARERIQKEFSPFQSEGISREALDYTTRKVRAVIGFDKGTRYRFINGMIFRQGGDPYGFDLFFRTLAALADRPGIPDLPNVDILLNHNDVTPMDFEPKGYWIAEEAFLQAPVLTFAKEDEALFLISVPDRFTVAEWWNLSKRILQASPTVPWNRKQKIAVWRGQPNDFAKLGMGNSSQVEIEMAYTKMPRYQICQLSSHYPNLVDAGFTSPGFSAVKYLIDFIMPFYKPALSQEGHLKYAYLPVLDGLTSTYPGFLWRLLSNSVSYKQASKDSQWFYDALKPYVHYVPIENDLSDLLEKISWGKKHDLECKKIADNATQFVIDNLMIEDVYFYFAEVLKEYEKCQNFFVPDLLEETLKDSEWIRIR